MIGEGRSWRAAFLCVLTATVAGAAVPDGGPPPLYEPETVLPAPAGWPFGEHFPRTSGAGRVAGGALFWSDFLYDDQGAAGAGPAANESTGAPSQGTYKYPEPDAAANGADLFRVAVGIDANDTWWRVDWNTLIDPSLPIAAFAIDLDGDPLTGGLAWPANTGVLTPGAEWLLVVSDRGAWLYDAAALPTPAPLDVTADLGGQALFDAAARSFTVRLPRSALDPSGVSTVYAVSGLADAEGDAFLQLDAAHGALPGQPNVYNAAFRDYEDEPPTGWFDRTQATELAAGDASEFAVAVDWSALLAGGVEPEPVVTGYVNRWYVSSIEPHQGIGSSEPLYGNRVQPYMAFIPSSYDPAQPPRLTWWLHGALSNHNSQPSNSPNTLQLMCEDRYSVCVSPLGRGPGGGYRNAAELDYFEVWRSVDADLGLDPDRTIQSGYSMGASGSYRMSFAYPDLYAAVVIMAGSANGNPRLANLRHTPYYHNHGGADELIPVTNAIATVDQLEALEYRFRFDLYPAEDHVVYAIQDHFEDAVEFMTEQDARPPDPELVTYVWSPGDGNAALDVGPTGAWWIGELGVRDAGSVGRVDARSLALRDPVVVDVVIDPGSPRPAAQPSPAVRRELSWVLGDPEPAEGRMTLALANVDTVAVDLVRAQMLGPAPAAGDWDGDGVADASDNCPWAPNPEQADDGGLGSAAPDGTGNACQCGDVSDNGQVNGQDANAIRRHALDVEPNPLFRAPDKCDVTGNGACNGQDGNAVRALALGAPSPYDGTACRAATGLRTIGVDSDGVSEVVLVGMAPGTPVELDAVPVGVAGADGRLAVSVPAGQHEIAIRP